MCNGQINAINKNKGGRTSREWEVGWTVDNVTWKASPRSDTEQRLDKFICEYNNSSRGKDQ
jgi:hypothetical protein